MKNIAIIPARGGSKRIPRKNIKLFMGKPIIAYSIEAAIETGIFDEVMVSTDDNEIADIAKKYGASVPFLRSKYTSNDYATTDDVICEVIQRYKEKNIIYDNICCIYSTAPFVTSSKIKEAFSLLDKYDSVFTAVAYSYPIQRSLRMTDGKISMTFPKYLKSRSQDLETIYHDAGQFYISKTDAYLKYKDFWGANTTAIILPETEVQDLDTLTDWKLAEMKFKLVFNEKENIL